MGISAEITNVESNEETGMQVIRYVDEAGRRLVEVISRLGPSLGGMATIAAWWGIWHLIGGMSVVAFWTWRDKVARAQEPQAQPEIAGGAG